MRSAAITAISLPLLRALAKKNGAPLALVHFDAHVDTWPDNFGQAYAHGSVFFHAIKEGLIDPRRTVQIGIRSPVQKNVYDWTVGKGVTIITAQEAHEIGLHDDRERMRLRSSATRPPISPSTSTASTRPSRPAPARRRSAGLRAGRCRRSCAGSMQCNFIGMDVVEVAPAYDTAEITALAAATIVWEYLALLGHRMRG